MKTLIIVTHPYIEKLLRPFELLADASLQLVPPSSDSSNNSNYYHK